MGHDNVPAIRLTVAPLLLWLALCCGSAEGQAPQRPAAAPAAPRPEMNCPLARRTDTEKAWCLAYDEAIRRCSAHMADDEKMKQCMKDNIPENVQLDLLREMLPKMGPVR